MQIGIPDLRSTRERTDHSPLAFRDTCAPGISEKPPSLVLGCHDCLRVDPWREGAARRLEAGPSDATRCPSESDGCCFGRLAAEPWAGRKASDGTCSSPKAGRASRPIYPGNVRTSGRLNAAVALPGRQTRVPQRMESSSEATRRFDAPSSGQPLTRPGPSS
jgi:hypothetical protein